MKNAELMINNLVLYLPGLFIFFPLGQFCFKVSMEDVTV